MKNGLILVTLIVLLSSCASNHLYQDAVPNHVKGAQDGRQIYATSLYVENKFEKDLKLDTNGRFGYLPIEFIRSFASNDKNGSNINIRYRFPSLLNIGVKYPLLSIEEDQLFYMAMEPQFSIDAITLIVNAINNDDEDKEDYDYDDEEDTFQPLYMDFGVAFYNTLRFSEYFSWTLTPQPKIRFGQVKFQALLGGNVMFEIGRSKGIILEGSYHRNYSYNHDEFQVGMAYFFNVSPAESK